MILLLITFVKFSYQLKVTKISDNEFEFESDFTYTNINESEQKFQSFITTSQFQLKSNTYIYSAFPRSTDVIIFNQTSQTCQIAIFMLGDIQNEPSIKADGNKLIITNIVHFSYAPLNEITLGQDLQIDNISNKQEFQIAKNNDNMGIVYCFDNKDMQFELTFQSLDYNETETHKGFLQDNISIEENCERKTRSIFTYDLLKPFTFELVNKQSNLKVLLEHQKQDIISYYDLKVNQANIERGQFIRITCTNQEVQNQNFLINAIPEKSDAGSTLKIAVIVISVIISIGLTILAVILIMIYCKKKNKVKEQNESEIQINNVFQGLHGHSQSDEEIKTQSGNDKSQIDDFKNESFQEQLMNSITKTEQYQYGSNLDFDTGKLKKASFDMTLEDEGFLNYEQQSTKKKIRLQRDNVKKASKIQPTISEDEFSETDQDINVVYQQSPEQSKEEKQTEEQKQSQNNRQSQQSKNLQGSKEQNDSDKNDRDTLLNQQIKFYNQNKQQKIQLQFQNDKC